MKPNVESIVLGGGCFWCLDAAYKLVKGVHAVTEGYAGGDQPNPTYEQVCSNTTGHAEVVQVSYDPTAISLEGILDIFWILHDPTTLNRQGYDVGTAYRSIILYNSEQQQAIAQKSKQAIAKLWEQPIVTEIVMLEQFYPAEDYQNDYEVNRPDYCQIIINPKLQKLRQKFADRLK